MPWQLFIQYYSPQTPWNTVIATASPTLFTKDIAYSDFYPETPPHYIEHPAEKRRLLKILTQSRPSRSQSICVLHALPGFGKKSLALSLLREKNVQDTYAEGIYWIDVGPEPYDLVDQLNKIGRDIDSDWEEEPLLEEALPKFHATLAGKSILVIFDDVWDIRQAALFRPAGASYFVLLTTQNELIAEALKAPQISISAPSLETAIELLGQRPGESEDKLQHLAYLLHYNPLALHIAGRLKERGSTLDELLETLDVEDKDEATVDKPAIARAMNRLLFLYSQLLPPHEAERLAALQVFPSRVPIPFAAIKTFWKSLADDGGHAPLLDELAAFGLVHYRIFSRVVVLSELLTQNLSRSLLRDSDALHQRLLDAYNPNRNPWWTLPDDGYIYRFLVRHLVEAGQSDKLPALLLDYEWIKAKVTVAGPVALYEDYNAVYEDKTLRVIQEAIRLSTSILARDPDQVGSQLIGRLQELDIPALRDLVDSFRMSPHDTDVWLDPYRVNLNVPESALLQTYKGHEGVIHAIAVDTENDRIISGSADGTIRLWDLHTGAHLETFRGHLDAIHHIDLTIDNRRIISYGDDYAIKIWDLKGKAATITHSLHEGKVLALQSLPDNQHALSSDDRGHFLLWEIESGKVLMDMAIPNHRIWSIAVDPSGRRAFTAGDENIVRVWDLDRGVCRHILSAHEDWVWCLKVTPNGRQLLSGSEDRSIIAWDLEDYKAMRVLKGHRGAVRAMDLSMNGRVLVSISDDQSMIEWNLDRGLIERSFTGHDEWVWDIAVTPKGDGAITASDDSYLKLWSLTGHTFKPENQAHEKGVRALKVTPDNFTVLSTSDDASLKRWRLDSGRIESVLEGHKDWIWDLKITSKGKEAVTASFDHTVTVWDLEKGKRKFLLEGHEDWVWSLALSWNDRYVFSGSEDGAINIWDLQTGRHLRTLEGHTAGITALLAIDDNRHFVSASQDHTVRIWRIEDGESLHVLEGHEGPVNTLALSTLDQRIASASDDGTIRLWNYHTGYESDVFRGHEGSVRHLAVTGLGSLLVSASEDLTLRFWDITLGREDHVIEGHRKEIRDIAVSRDGRLVASASDDHALFLWHLHTGELLASFYADYPITRCAFTIDDQRLIAGDAGGGLHFLRVDEMMLFV